MFCLPIVMVFMVPYTTSLSCYSCTYLTLNQSCPEEAKVLQLGTVDSRFSCVVWTEIGGSLLRQTYLLKTECSSQRKEFWSQLMLSKWNVTGVMDCCDEDLCNQPTNETYSISPTKPAIQGSRSCTKALIITGSLQLVPDILIAMKDDETCMAKNIDKDEITKASPQQNSHVNPDNKVKKGKEMSTTRAPPEKQTSTNLANPDFKYNDTINHKKTGQTTNTTPESKRRILVFYVFFSKPATKRLTIRLLDGNIDPRRMYSMQLVPPQTSAGMLGVKFDVIEDTGLGQSSRQLFSNASIVHLPNDGFQGFWIRTKRPVVEFGTMESSESGLPFGGPIMCWTDLLSYVDVHYIGFTGGGSGVQVEYACNITDTRSATKKSTLTTKPPNQAPQTNLLQTTERVGPTKQIKDSTTEKGASETKFDLLFNKTTANTNHNPELDNSGNKSEI